ncbi:DMT family transporter [Marinomonas epiphytica]
MDGSSVIRKGIVLTLAYAFVMSITALSAKQLQTQVAVSAVVFWQSLICSLILLPQMKGHWQRRPWSVWQVHLLRSGGGFAGFLFYYWSLNHIPLVEASLLRTCAPLCVPFVVWLMHKIVIPPRRWLPLVIGFVGVALIIRPTPNHVNPWHLVGFLSALGLSVSMVTTRMLSHQVSGRETLLVYFSISCGLSLLLAWGQGDSLMLPMEQWPLMLTVALTLYVGMYWYNKAYTFAPASLISPVSYIGVVFSGVWGWLIWGHVPDFYACIGMICIFVSILISARLVKG